MRSALAKFRAALVGVLVLSAALNILMLAGSIYLMLVYDRVLPSQSGATLFSLFLMVGIAYAFQGAFEAIRSQMLAEIAALLDRRLSARVQSIEMRLALERPDARERMSPSHDLDQLRTFISSSGLPALMDLPWILFFVLVLSLIHYWLGIATVVGALVLAYLTWTAERTSKQHAAAASEAGIRRRNLRDRLWRHAELISILGMRGRFMAQLQGAHLAFLSEQSRLTDTSARLSVLSKIFRMFLQSSVLTIGALLVIDGKATGGVIFASSILSARALAPVDQVIANWRGFVAARQSWARLNELLPRVVERATERTQLPPPVGTLAVDQLTLMPPGNTRAVVVDVKFAVAAGQGVGIIGPSASGKSSLVRGIVGAWKPVRGSVRLDGGALDQWDSEALGAHIGYVPQSVELFGGTVAENIARFEMGAPSELVIAAAAAAGVHEMILQLAQGYETPVNEAGANLSAGQRQRIALARALYRDPFLVALDEPNSNLDPEGEAALASAIEGVKSRGGIVLVVAHRAAVLSTVDLLLVMRGGAAQAFGPRDEVLAKLNPTQPPSGRDPGEHMVISKRG